MKKIKTEERNPEYQGMRFVVLNRVVREGFAGKLKEVGNKPHR